MATASQQGTVVSGTDSGTYSVNEDCTGTATFNSGAHLNFVVVGSGREVDFIQTDDNTVIAGSASVLGNGGSMAHVASGGGWQTTFTIANTGTVAAQAKLSFFENNGNPLALPLTGVESGPVTKSTLTETIAPGAMLVISTQASTALIGSAQLTTSSAVSGFAVFRYNPTGQEAVVPLETRNASAYVLAFDNTNGVSTGVALANSSGQSAKVLAVLRDSSGASLGTETINLPAHGHTSFVLASSYASVAGKQGTVEFDIPGGGPVSVLGLRSTPTGALTTIPCWRSRLVRRSMGGMQRILLALMLAGPLYADDAGGELFRGFGFIGLLLIILIVVVGVFGWFILGLLSDILEGMKNGFSTVIALLR